MDRVMGGGPESDGTRTIETVPTEYSGNAAQASKGLPTQAIILALVAVLVIPGIVFAGFLLARYAESERARYEIEGIGVARAAATVLDRYLQGLRTTLQTLAESNSLADGDLKRFSDLAARVSSYIGSDIVLQDETGQQLVSTRRPYGSVLPRTPFPIDQATLETHVPIVTNVFHASTTGRPLIAIAIAVNVAGVRHSLHISTPTDRLREIIAEVAPPHWLIGVGDANGVFVTRSERHDDFSGRPGATDYIAKADRFEGSFIGRSDGEPTLVGYSHTGIGHWLVAAKIKQSVVEKGLTDSLYILAAFGIMILVVSSLVALWLWRFVARPLEGLAVASRHIGELQGPIPVETRLREFVAVRDALSAAAEQIRVQQHELEMKVADRTQELARANDQLIAQMAAREKAEGQLRQIQKMEAVGQLTSGIAHDFNNMLLVVMSSLSLIQRRIERGDMDIQRFIAAALEGVNRAKTLTSRLLAFSRQQPLAPEALDPNRLVAGMSDLLRRSLGEAIRIETVLGAGLWKIFADAPQLENAILNLCVNARDAMQDGGRLTIETSNAYLDEDYCAANEGITTGQYVLIAVTDTGIGMTADILSRAFDPFFTTKRTGLGTGLGLSQVYGFVKQSRGHVKIYSEPGHGTTIKVYLPRHYGEEATPSVRRDERRALVGAAHEVILVVEDEDRLRALTVDTLSELGYTVLQAGHARDALDLVEKHSEICLLFTDIVMPDVNGRQLADEALRRRPNLRILFTTGFTRNAVVHNGILDTGVNFIPKPFTMEEVAWKVRQVLGEGGPKT